MSQQTPDLGATPPLLWERCQNTRGGALNLFARVEQGGLGITCPPGIEPGWTWYQQSLAHHRRHQYLRWSTKQSLSARALMSWSAFLLTSNSSLSWIVLKLQVSTRHLSHQPRHRLGGIVTSDAGRPTGV